MSDTPGWDEAKANGCMCPDKTVQVKHFPLYLVNVNCPLHGRVVWAKEVAAGPSDIRLHPDWPSDAERQGDGF